MAESIRETVFGTVKGLHNIGLVDDITMRNIKSLCLPKIEKYTPEKISSIRKKLKLSQAALAKIFNVSTSTIQKWEQGLKKPAGASKRLLNILENKGLEVFI